MKKHKRTNKAEPEERGAATNLNAKDARITRNKGIVVEIAAIRTHEIATTCKGNDSPPFDMGNNAVNCTVQR